MIDQVINCLLIVETVGIVTETNQSLDNDEFKDKASYKN